MPDIVPNPKVLAQDVVCEKNLLAKSVKSLALVWHVGKITPILIVPVKVIWTFTCEGVMSPNWQTDLQMQITNVLLIAEVPNCKDNRESHKDVLAQWRGKMIRQESINDTWRIFSSNDLQFVNDGLITLLWTAGTRLSKVKWVSVYWSQRGICHMQFWLYKLLTHQSGV